MIGNKKMAEAFLGLIIGTVFLVLSFIIRGDDPSNPSDLLAIFGSILFCSGLFVLILELL